MIEFRPEQQEAIDALFQYYRANKENRSGLIVVPPAGGKSIIGAGIIQYLLKRKPECRILSIVHKMDLVDHNSKAFKSVCPDIKFSIYNAGLKKKCLQHNVIFGSIQSLHGKHLFVGKIDLLIIDEAHLIPSSSQGQYRDFINELLKINPQMRIAGMTGTPWRMDNGSLLNGDDSLFDAIVYEIPLKKMFEEGRICPVVTPSEEDKKIVGDFTDLKINKMNNEYTTSSVEASMLKIIYPALKEAVSLGRDRKAGFIFCPSLRMCDDVLKFLREIGESCELVTSKTKDRLGSLARFKSGKVRWLITVDALTTGTDCPILDVIIILRAIHSTNLLLQMYGRGFRLYENKHNCLILDYGQNFDRHGAIDKIEPPPEKVKRNKEGKEVVESSKKECLKCGQEVGAKCETCPFCGHGFMITRKIEKEAAVGDLISSIKPPEWIGVKFVTKNRHKKEGKPDCLRVTYICDNKKPYSEYLCIEHNDPYSKKNVFNFYNKMGRLPPSTVSEAEKTEIFIPDKILVNFNGKYPKILDREWSLEGARI